MQASQKNGIATKRITITLPEPIAENWKLKTKLMGHDLSTVAGELMLSWIRVYGDKDISLGEISNTIRS